MKTYIIPWEQVNQDKSFFIEMFTNQFGDQADLSSLTNPIDESKPSFKKALKTIFRDIYDLTGQSKLKPTIELIENALVQDMRVVIYGVHMSYLTGIEDYLFRKQIDFLYIGKNIGDHLKQNICDNFNEDSQQKVVLVDLSEQMTNNFQFNCRDAFAIIGETLWNLDVMDAVDYSCKLLKNITFLFGRHTLDEFLFRFLY